MGQPPHRIVDIGLNVMLHVVILQMMCDRGDLFSDCSVKQNRESWKTTFITPPSRGDQGTPQVGF